MTTATSPILLKWDPKSLEIRTLTVERLLEPLVTQVTTLVNTSNKGPSSKKKGRSKKAHVLAVSVEQATQNFLEKGEQIAKDSHDLKEELIAAVEDVRKQGETMRVASSEFADDPCSSVKRGTMVRAARALLSAVTRLLILADMADVMRLLAHLKIVEEALEGVKNATNEQDLANRFKEFGKEMVKLNYVAARRQQELKDPQCRDEMAAARGALKKNATMLYTASQAFLRHPDVAATRANRDYVFKQVQEAIGAISSAAQAASPTDEKHGHAGIGELAAALNEFDGHDPQGHDPQGHNLRDTTLRDTTSGTRPQGHNLRDTTSETQPQGHDLRDTTSGTRPQGHDLRTRPQRHDLRDTTSGTRPQGHDLRDTTSGTRPQGHDLRDMSRFFLQSTSPPATPKSLRRSSLLPVTVAVEVKSSQAHTRLIGIG
ncbi:catenin alpha-2-like [Osmerus eperlanus]|uniref:catenin alpha-2-like n=1 Tax=Osmerus eperlanus TaxID=29151 RepID=UPI002E146102